MTDNEVQVEVQQLEEPPSGKDAFVDPSRENNMSGEESDCTESLQSFQQREVESLLLLADVALAPPFGAHVSCRCLEVRRMEGSLQSIQLQFLFLKSKADGLQDCLVSGQGSLEGEALAAAVLSLLHTCQPYFNYVESTARSTVSQHTHLPADICLTRRVQLLDFSEQLCDRLEQLVLTFASYNLLCLDETEPNGVSHFCIGQFQLSRLRMTIFRYCKPTPYLAQGDTGLYKCMRWNVERLRDKQQKDKEHSGESDEEEEETVVETDYYFLCYEDIPNAHADADKDNQSVSNGSMVRMWSIGQWVQVYPDPDTEDICDWILCDVPQADYDRLLFLGSDEPSCCSATDYLQQLLSHLTD
ncbi:UPF0575 protein C19orf67 homolog [Amphiprion ocellaris]|uniref:Uncharacterized protein n=1 Tax=Amphiprion ocellaris TaxID=80972 RepID=A0A3Q1B241_AMPOC|nr:UPF0575 protein C19orf67 homolog [Amphiprion ocellaris]